MYIEKLFGNNNRNEDHITVSEKEIREITKNEVMQAIKNVKIDKSPGPDEIPSEFRRYYGSVDLFNSIGSQNRHDRHKRGQKHSRKWK